MRPKRRKPTETAKREAFLAPLLEGPTPEDEGSKKDGRGRRSNVNNNHRMRHWTSSIAMPLLGHKPSDPRLLLGVLGCPLAPAAPPTSMLPLPRLFLKEAPIETSSAQYIVHQYIAATGGFKLHCSIRNSYAMGRVRMLTSEFETATRITKNPLKAAENGWFVLWQMMPDKWHVELEIEENSVQAGSDGKVVWRYTPWLGANAANGPVRPLRRALQGIDPITTSRMFIHARCVGERKIGEEECFVLKLAADPDTLSSRSEGPAEIIRHVLFGYFSQRTGLLVFLEDSHLTRIQAVGGEAIYWETTIESSLQDYRTVDGMNIAHAGHSVVTLFRFGEEAMSHTKTRMEEMWTIEEVAFNVQGLSSDCFIPPSEVGKENSNRNRQFACEKGNNS